MIDETNPFKRMQENEHGPDVFPDTNKPDVELDVKPRKGRPKKKTPVQEIEEKRPKVGATERKKRIPIGLREPKQTPTRKGFYRRWVNDTTDQLSQYADGGYTKVLDEGGNPRQRRAGAGITQFLLEIDEDLHEADQEEKYKRWNKDAQERLKPREGKGYYTPKK